MGQVVRAAMTAFPLHIRQSSSHGVGSGPLTWWLSALMPGETRAKACHQLSLAVSLTLGLALSFGTEGQNVEQNFVSGAMAVLSRHRAFRLA